MSFVPTFLLLVFVLVTQVLAQGCPPGYDSKEGHIPGRGKLDGTIYTDKKGCSDRCSINEHCCSFEYSDSWKFCNLNRDCQPSAGKYWDYVFCMKQNVRGYPETATRCKCGVEGGTRNAGMNRIVGGKNVPFGKYPWIASVTINNHRATGICGATLIATRWAITAAHCVRDKQGNPRHITSIILGQHVGFKRKEVKVVKIFVHPNYRNPRDTSNDIALFKLAEEVDLSVYTPACLPKSRKNYLGKIASVYGWGKMSKCHNWTPKRLKEAKVQIVSDATCKTAHGTYMDYDENTRTCFKRRSNYATWISSDMLCVKPISGSACSGDSGGPLTVKEYGQHKLVGVVSWSAGCAEAERGTLYDVYAEVAQLREWVDYKIAMNGGATYCSK